MMTELAREFEYVKKNLEKYYSRITSMPYLYKQYNVCELRLMIKHHAQIIAQLAQSLFVGWNINEHPNMHIQP